VANSRFEPHLHNEVRELVPQAQNGEGPKSADRPNGNPNHRHDEMNRQWAVLMRRPYGLQPAVALSGTARLPFRRTLPPVVWPGWATLACACPPNATVPQNRQTFG